MARVNDHFLKLTAGYLFPEIGRRVAAFAEAHPDAEIIRMGIGDVTEPLPEAIRVAMHKAVDDLGARETFHGYGPEQGYPWLREKIAEVDFRGRHCDIDADEIFISDGSKCDTANILDILAAGRNTIAVTDPVYPVYVDTNVMAGNAGPAGANGRYGGIVYLPATAENDFTPNLPTQPVDVIYLCSPNNPTGAVMTRSTLAQWVAYAKEHDALILFDAAYEAYISDPAIPHSIYELPGARDVAIEFRSFSKKAGFTGVRCAFTVIPKGLTAKADDGARVPLHRLWLRRQSTKFNGVSYIVQRAAEACYTEAGQQQVQAIIDHYMGNAKIILKALAKLGLIAYGGVNAPYIWLKTPTPGGSALSSWDLFDKLLTEAHIVGTPGSGFGAAGEGYFRISAFNSRENVEQAMHRMRTRLKL